MHPAVLHGLKDAVDEIVRIVHDPTIPCDGKLAAAAVVQELFRPVPKPGLPGQHQQVMAELEHRPATAGNLAASPFVVPHTDRIPKIPVTLMPLVPVPVGFQGIPQLPVLCGEKAFRRAIASGGKGVMPEDLLISILYCRKVTLLLRGQICHGSAGEAVHMAVGMAGSHGEIFGIVQK